jgi:hypothetical protein
MSFLLNAVRNSRNQIQNPVFLVDAITQYQTHSTMVAVILPFRSQKALPGIKLISS